MFRPTVVRIDIVDELFPGGPYNGEAINSSFNYKWHWKHTGLGYLLVPYSSSKCRGKLPLASFGPPLF